MNEVILTIVIATLNSERTIRRALDSVVRCFGSFGPKVQVVIKDGESRDGTAELVRSYLGPLRVELLVSRDTGIYDAWNQALKIAVGSWILFLGSDDEYINPEAIAEILRSLNSIDGDLCYSSMLVHCGGNDELVSPDLDSVERVSLTRMPVPHPTLFHKSDLVRRLGGFDDGFSIAGDYDFFMRAIKGGAQIRKINSAPIVRFHVGGVSNSPRHALRSAKETLGIKFRFGSYRVRLAEIKAICAGLIFLILGEAIYTRVLSFAKRALTARGAA